MVRYPLNLPSELKRAAEELAKQQGVSLNQFILWSVAEKVGALRQGLDDPNFPQVTYRRGASGKPTPVLRGTAIRVQTLATAANTWGMSIRELAAQYELDERSVESAMAFYAAHQQEIDRDIETEARLGDGSR